MKLYGFWRSSASWRARIALNWKGVDYEYVPVNLLAGGQREAAYLAVNPMGQVPTLVLDDGRQLSQSMAILEYLEETVPEPPLLPRDPYLRARVRQLAELVNAGIQPLQNTETVRQLKTLGVDEKPWLKHFVGRGLDALEATAQAHAGKFLVGDEVSFAEVCLVPQLQHARRFELDLARWPLLTRVDAACNAMPAFHRAHADRQPDAVVTK